MKLHLPSTLLAGLLLANFYTVEGKDTCRLWLAPSSIAPPNTVQYGIYAGVDFDKDDIIPDVELAIPYIDFFVDGNRRSDYTTNILSYLEQNMWTADYSTSKFEGNISTSPFVPGIGSIGNYHALIANADWLMSASFLREREDITEPGKPHLSRGAISNVYNMTMVATQKIPAGMEIFPNFGDMWDKEEASTFQDKLTRTDIMEANKVLDKIVEFYERFESEMSEEMKEDMLDFMLDKILGAAAGSRAAVIRSLIPPNYRKLRKVKEAGGTFQYRFRDLIRKTKWLEQNGVCVDTMYPAKSTIPAAGRGAFASRDFAEGDTITVVPTVLLGARELMSMYEFTTITFSTDGNEKTETKRIDYDRTKPRGQQVGLNYAFGHKESTFLFLPTAPMVHYINHNSAPNARLQWSTHETMNYDKATWGHSVAEVMNFKSNMVVFEIEATKDIKKGEEIFIHYGDDWVQAWDEYERLWAEKYENKPWPLRAEDLKLTFKEKPYPVESGTGNSNLLPSGVATACFIKCDSVPDGTPRETEDGTPIQQFTGPGGYSGVYLKMCDLKERHEDGNGSYNYTVTASINSDGVAELTQVKEVPHSAITVVDTAYAGDLHFPDAFRHFIGIPNEIFPQNWRDAR